MSTLYQIPEEMQQLLALAEDPEVEDINPEVFRNTFEMLEMDFEDKADAYAKVIRELEDRDAAIKGEVDRLTARRRNIQNSISRMKEALQGAMVSVGKPKFSTTLFSFGIQKNPASVVIDDEKRLPDIFIIPQPPKIDKVSLKEMLKKGDNAAMFEGIAHLEQTEGLRIR